MKSEHNEITHGDLSWLHGAINDYNKRQIIYIFDNSAIATDTYRMHIINPDSLPEDMNQIPKSAIDTTFNLGPSLSSFHINSEYLQEALAGFEGRVKIELLGDAEGFHGIKISNDSNKVAFVACMKKDDEDD